MSLVTQVSSLATRISTEIKAVRAVTGTLSSLNTADKTNLVAAINEIKTAAASASGINDTGTSASSAWSSSNTQAKINAAVAALVGSAPATLDAFNELANALGGDANFATTTATALGNRLRTDGTAQTISSANQAVARTSLGVPSTTEVGDTTTDFVAVFNAGLL